MASASPTASTSCASSVPGASTSSHPSGSRIERSRSRSSKTWSVTRTFTPVPRGSAQSLLVERVLREQHGTVLRHEQVLLETHGLLEPRMPGERLAREVHVLLQLDRIVERVRARDPHALVEGESDRVRELLERDRPELVVGVRRELRGDVGRRVPRLHLLDRGVHRLIALLVEILLLGSQRLVDLEAADEVDEVAAGTDRVLVDDHEIALADDLVGVPAPVRARVAARGHDDVVDEVEALLVEVLVDLRRDVALLDARLQPLVLDLPERGVADRARDLQALELVGRLPHTRRRHRGPGARRLDPGALERRSRRRVVDVDPD